jgi:hypothetical protein
MKICDSPTSVIFSLSLPWCRLSSGRHHHATASCHASFPWSQDEFTTSASASDNASSCCLPSWAETKALNLHHRHRQSSPDSLTPTLHCYKKIISILVTLPTTQLRLHFAFSLARAAHHWSSTRCHHSLSSPSHAHRPLEQRHPWWWTSWPSFTSRTIYRHVNSGKNVKLVINYLWIINFIMAKL